MSATTQIAPSPSAKPWVDPHSLPMSSHVISNIAGNVPDYVKQLNCNTFESYGVGGDDSFGSAVGRAVKFVDVNIERRRTSGKLEATTVCEIVVSKGMLNGAGMMHGGCLAYLIDNCASTPLVVLGLMQSVNGVGVTQGLQITYHSPAPLGARLQIVSTSVTLGSRVMTSRCEVTEMNSGRIVASALINKMQPAPSKL
ncbi:hypothetical protein BV25DRAFT_1812855 [Artomyces pyxidatus]|uniref:Uncharacterized protein n=1 Tax=Artomyces pyxidatus TaxID=48021 RepID=A0ACB8SN10_9AGAM|nr:hypothetical protein BV25DRAFT_1812855 [Artomyces pyxidatus]